MVEGEWNNVVHVVVRRRRASRKWNEEVEEEEGDDYDVASSRRHVSRRSERGRGRRLRGRG